MTDTMFLHAIGHPTRLRALLLMEEQSREVTDLAGRVGVPLRVMEHHLNVLHEFGLVEPRPAGSRRTRRWGVTTVGWTVAVDALRPFAPGGDPYDTVFLAALSHPLRAELLRMLDENPVVARSAAERSQLTLAAMQHHLGALEAAHLVCADVADPSCDEAATVWRTAQPGWDQMLAGLDGLMPAGRA